MFVSSLTQNTKNMKNLFYIGQSTERVKIVEFIKFGIVKTRNKQGETNFNHISNLKPVQ